MSRVNAALAEYYTSALKETKGQPPLEFDDTSRGVLLALIKDRPTIWNSSAKLTKDDVLASFQQCAAILSNMDPSFSIWVIIEKWCWVVESYIRSLSLNPPVEWRYNNTLDYLRPFNSFNYPYMGCISKARLAQLTKLYADPQIIQVMEATESLDFAPGIFREELAVFAGEEVMKVTKVEAEIFTKTTVGQIVNAKRRGRPARGEKRSPSEQFINLTPQSAQFQKLLENTSSASSTNSDYDNTDEYGFTNGMCSSLIEMVHEKPELWSANHPQRDNVLSHERLFDQFAKELASKYRDTVEATVLDKLSGPFVGTVWNKLKERFREEEISDTPSRWRWYQPLQFLSSRLMPALLLENVFIKSEDPSTSAGLTARLAVSSPAGSTQSEDSRMAASSPATSAQFVALPTMTNGNKSIQTVLENLVARSLKEDQNAGIQSADYSELKQILEQNKIIKVENDGSPPTKRVKQSVSPPGSSRMIVYNDARKTTQAPISTWVPPREDLIAKSKEEPATPTPKKAQATAVIKSGFPLEKHFKKIFQQNTPSLVPVTAASIQTRNGLIGLNPMVIPPSALQQALSLNKIETTTPITTRSQMPSVSTQPTIQAQVLMNGAVNGNSEHEDKWALLGRMITMMAREVESRDPIAASELFRDLQQTLCQHQIKSLMPKENNSSQ